MDVEDARAIKPETTAHDLEESALPVSGRVGGDPDDAADLCHSCLRKSTRDAFLAGAG